MDPALWDVLEGGASEEEVAAIIRLHPGARPPPGVRLVARFGTVATCRLRRADILAIRHHPSVASLKASRPIVPEPVLAHHGPVRAATRRRGLYASEEAPTGRGTVVGVVDWGCDFTHPNFLRHDGRTRLLALWDQRGPNRRSPYGYGVIHDADAIDRALGARDPFDALGYDPVDVDLDGTGTHGTHVLDIAAGAPRVGPGGVAPGAELVFVHMAMHGEPAGLGGSVTLLEAIDFIARTAGDRPWVINLSLGSHGGPHDGSTLVERAMDALVTSAPGRAIVQSCGNYFERPIHTTGHLRAGEQRTIDWLVDPSDDTPNELEIWYPGADALSVRLHSPSGRTVAVASPGSHGPILLDGEPIGRFAHRTRDPNNGDNHVSLLVDPIAGGTWRVVLEGLAIEHGDYHVWIERDEVHPGSQSRLRRSQAIPSTTIGTICNGHHTIVVGACDPRSGKPAYFSSSGPTRDGRTKPDVLAPGIGVVAARSAPWAEGGDDYLTTKSGTSMAAPHVTGTVALLYEAAARPLGIGEVRRILRETAQPAPAALAADRSGTGYVDLTAAVALAQSAELAKDELSLEDEPLAEDEKVDASALKVRVSVSPGAATTDGSKEGWTVEASTEVTVEVDVTAPGGVKYADKWVKVTIRGKDYTGGGPHTVKLPSSEIELMILVSAVVASGKTEKIKRSYLWVKKAAASTTASTSAPASTSVAALKNRKAVLDAIIANASKSFGEVAAAITELKDVSHDLSVLQTGTGLYEGKECETTTAGAIRTDCTEIVIEVLAEAFKNEGRESDWKKIMKKARGNTKTRSGSGLSGIDLQAALQSEDGWKGIFWAPDPAYPIPDAELVGAGMKSGEAATALKHAKKDKAYYDKPTKGYPGVSIDQLVIDYAPEAPNPGEGSASKTTKDTAQLAKLRKIPFGVLSAHGGEHMTLITYGKVVEVHWDLPATDPDVIEETDLETWAIGPKSGYHYYASGAIVAPAADVDAAFSSAGGRVGPERLGEELAEEDEWIVDKYYYKTKPEAERRAKTFTEKYPEVEVFQRGDGNWQVRYRPGAPEGDDWVVDEYYYKTKPEAERRAKALTEKHPKIEVFQRGDGNWQVRYRSTGSASSSGGSTGTSASVKRSFVIVYGDKGLGDHDVGKLFEMAARTHESEVKSNAFPGVPAFTSSDATIVAHVSTVSDLVKQLDVGDVAYLAYFGHSWNDGSSGALYIGEAAAPDTNLSDAGGDYDTPATKLPAKKFRSDAEVRLFGCRGAYGTDSAAEQIAGHLKLPAFGYENDGGSLFTDDVDLGHGKRSVTQADLDKRIKDTAKNVWLIPANGTPTFKKFGP